MAKKPKEAPKVRRGANLEDVLGEIDSFLEGGAEGLSKEAGAEQKVPSKATRNAEEDTEGEAGGEGTADGKLSLSVSEDGLEATLRLITPETTEEGILELLRSEGISSGIDEAGIRKAVETLQEYGQPLKDMVVAKGKPPKPAPPPRMEPSLPKGIASLPPLEPIQKLTELAEKGVEEAPASAEEAPASAEEAPASAEGDASSTPDANAPSGEADAAVEKAADPAAAIEGAAAAVEVWAVQTGDELAIQVVDMDTGEPGTDVRGQPIPPPPQEVGPHLIPGPGVELNGISYLAKHFGFAGLINGQVSVMEPILWISPDGLEAFYINLSLLPSSKPPGQVDLKSAVVSAGITVDADEEVASLAEQFEKGRPEDLLIPIAHGTPVVPPGDSTPKFSFDYESQVGTIRPDGSIDFKERNMFPNVDKDALLAEYKPPVPGEPGQTVRGEEIPLGEPENAELVAGENARLEESEDEQKVYAEVDGGASVQSTVTATQEGKVTQYTVAVRPVAQISSDIGYETGNVDFEGNVDIKGSLTSGFSVKTTGDVAISEAVEADTVIEAGGSVTVSQGIVGHETSIKAGGTVTAKFISEAKVEAGEDVVVGSYILGAHVNAKGRVQVEGRGGQGGILSGEIWAIKGITSRNVGSPRGKTNLVIGADPERLSEFEKAGEQVRHVDTILGKLQKTLKLESLDPEEIQKLAKRLPGKKEMFISTMEKVGKLAEYREQQLKVQKEVGGRLAEEAKEAKLEVPETAYTGVTVRIGNEQIRVNDDLKRVCYHLQVKDGEPGIVWSDLSPGS